MRNIQKVLTTLEYDGEHWAQFLALFPESEVERFDVRDTPGIMKSLKTADVAILNGDLDVRFLAGDKLKWIHCDHAGLSTSARSEIFERGIILTGSSGRSSPVLAEHCIYFMLQSCYHTKELLAAQKAHQWGVEGMKDWRGLFGRTAGIIGMGNNGRMLAERLHALGMNLICYSRSEPEGFDYITKLVTSRGDKLDLLLEQSDFIILTVALTDETYHLIDRSAFEKMKRGTTIVNISRGQIMETEALLDALHSGIVNCAGLDVFEQEPLPADSPIWDEERIYVTPHTTPQVPDRTGRSLGIIAENVRRYRMELPMINQVTERDVFHKANDAYTQAEKAFLERMKTNKGAGK